jgi:sulfide:quinone oxidoreductase
MPAKIVVLGAGFGCLELSTILSDALGDRLDLTLIDRSDAFVFGYSKLELMFGRERAEAVRLPYRAVAKPGVRFRQETITAIDPVSRRVTTSEGTHDSDVLVVALGADYDVGATPGLAEAGHEFYSVEGAERLAGPIRRFEKGHAIVGVTSAPFKCPPAPSEAALLLHDDLLRRGVRDACEISLVMPFPSPIPPSPDASKALLAAFAERGIRFVPERPVRALDPGRKVAILRDGSEMPFDLFLGIPRHRAPEVVVASGMTEDGWVPVSRSTLETRFPGVYAIGDVTSVGTPKAGVFAEGAAKVAAAAILARLENGDEPDPYAGAGTCYVEFGSGRVGRVDVDFFSGPKPTGTYLDASAELVRHKMEFGATRRSRWFGLGTAASGITASPR